MGTPKVPDFWGDWRMPSDAVATLWQQELENLSALTFRTEPVAAPRICRWGDSLDPRM